MQLGFDDAQYSLGGSGYRALLADRGSEKGFEYDSTKQRVRILNYTGLSADRFTFFVALSERPQLLGIYFWREGRRNQGFGFSQTSRPIISRLTFECHIFD